ALRRFASLLRPDGFLFLGQTEAMFGQLGDFDVVQPVGGFLFRRRSASRERPPAPAPVAKGAPTFASAPPPASPPPPPPAPPAPPAAPPAAPAAAAAADSAADQAAAHRGRPHRAGGGAGAARRFRPGRAAVRAGARARARLAPGRARARLRAGQPRPRCRRAG